MANDNFFPFELWCQFRKVFADALGAALEQGMIEDFTRMHVSKLANARSNDSLKDRALAENGDCHNVQLTRKPFLQMKALMNVILCDLGKSAHHRNPQDSSQNRNHVWLFTPLTSESLCPKCVLEGH
jgi:hypothetical protein